MIAAMGGQRVYEANNKPYPPKNIDIVRRSRIVQPDLIKRLLPLTHPTLPEVPIPYLQAPLQAHATFSKEQ